MRHEHRLMGVDMADMWHQQLLALPVFIQTGPYPEMNRPTGRHGAKVRCNTQHTC